MSDESKTEEGLDNTNAIANIVETGDMHEVAMILGSRERIRHAGVIRPGIKIPLAGCSQAQKDLYARLLDEGHGFEFIDAEMLKIADKSYSKKTCLRPSNSDYFTIRDEDFKRPDDAEYIRKQYADPDGKVRRIPCWLMSSDREKIIPHNFRAFSAGGLRCVSFYDHGRLKFKYLPKDFKGDPKPEDWKILDSDDEDKATKACGIDVKFGGMYRFEIDGVRGAGSLVCPTQSWYGLGESMGVINMLLDRYGRCDGLMDGKTFLELRKEMVVVKTPEGKKQSQYVVTLDLSVPKSDLEKYYAPAAVVARSANALSLLTGHRPPAPSTSSVVESLPAPGHQEPETIDSAASVVERSDADTTGVQAPSTGVATVTDDKQKAIDALNALIAPHGLFMADMETLYSAEHRGVDISEATMDELRAFYKVVANQLKTDTERFVSDIKDQRCP